jgi:PAS domain-containing protein
MPKKTKAHLSARNNPSLTRIAARKRTKAKHTKQSKETKKLQNAPFGAEERLQKSEGRFAAFMDNLPGYAWLKDLQGRYVYINRAVRGLSGYRSL